MLSIKLMGGLGNQLFQIVSTISIAMDNGYRFGFEYSEMLTTGTSRPTYWKSVFHKLQMFLFTSSLYERIPFHQIKELSFNYKPITLPPNPKKYVQLLGYYQSPKYFHHNFDNIRLLLGINTIQQVIRDKYKHLLTGPTISLHFRLGDYKQQQNKSLHLIVGLDYYRKALNVVLKNFPGRYTVLYFCEEEDNDFVANRIMEMAHTSLTFIKVPDDIPDYEQMMLMSVCDHNIIANSTFSWWGAYLNGSKNKLVCYPKKWFGEKSKLDTGDLFLDTWVPIL